MSTSPTKHAGRVTYGSSTMLRVDFITEVVFCPVDPDLRQSYDLIKALSGGAVWATVYKGAPIRGSLGAVHEYHGTIAEFLPPDPNNGR